MRNPVGYTSGRGRRLGCFKFQLPADFLTFYKKCNGISLDDLSIRPFEMLEDTSKEEVERMIAGISIETEADSIQVSDPEPGLSSPTSMTVAMLS